jgi:hypothetical protein
MNILKTLILACGLTSVCLASAETAISGSVSNNAPASGVQTVQTALPVNIVQTTQTLQPAGMTSQNKVNPGLNVAVGTPFNIKLNEDKNCAATKPLDQINLLINGIETGLHPLGCDPATREMAFSMSKEGVTASPVTNAAWDGILGRPWTTINSGFQRELKYTVIQPADSANAQILSSGKLKLLIANLDIGLVGAGMVAALWIALAYLGKKSGMLRDNGNQGYTLQHRTYSLGRVQMAWWFGIVMGSYIFLWMISQEIPTLSSQALLLMGISGATGLTSAGLNAGMQKQLPVSGGKFFEDLLTDAYGVTLHRFQMLAVTIILGVMFIIHVANTLSMPEFDGSLLALMGIAGGTYVGFKIPETQVDASNSPAAATPAAILEEHKTGYTPEPEQNDGAHLNPPVGQFKLGRL